MARTLLRTLTVLVVASAAGAGLAACTTPGSPTASPTTSDSSSATVAPTVPVPSETASTPSATPTPTPTPTSTVIAGSPVGVSCDQLVTAQQFYDFNSNYTLSDSYTPKAGSRAATVVGLKGLACEWINDSSNEKIVIAVANLGQQGMLQQQDKLAAGAKEVEVGGTSGYFATAGSVGRTDAFALKYWIVADSTAFASADDASDLIADAIANLPH